MSDVIPHTWPALSLDGRPGRSAAFFGLNLARWPLKTLVKLGGALMLLTLLVTALLGLMAAITAKAPAISPPVAGAAVSGRSIAMIPETGKPTTVPAAPPSTAPPSTATWLEIVKPVHLYNLEAHDVAKLPFTYAARRLDNGNAREDRLDFGSWQADHPSLHLTIVRDGPPARASLDTAIVRQAADVGLAVSRSKLPDTLKTRFGTFEIADVGATDAANKGVPMTCSGFRLGLSAPRLAIDGFACGTAGQPIPRKALACLIDRLDLVSAGEDRALIDFFAMTDLRRDRDCEGMRLGPDGVHAAWLDTPDDPAPAPVKPRRHRHRH